MYDSNNESISIDQATRNHRTEVLSRLYGMEFNLIPVSGKHPPCIEWKPFQTKRVSLEKIKEWMRGKFPTKDGKKFWKPKILNFALITGATPWSSTNPGIIVVDTDDEEAEALVKERCPETPMMQVTGSGGFHRVYRRPDFSVSNRQKTWIGGKEHGIDIRGDGAFRNASRRRTEAGAEEESENRGYPTGRRKETLVRQSRFAGLGRCRRTNEGPCSGEWYNVVQREIERRQLVASDGTSILLTFEQVVQKFQIDNVAVNFPPSFLFRFLATSVHQPSQ